MIKVTIVDDHFLVREGVERILKQEGFDMELVGQAASADGLMDELGEGPTGYCRIGYRHA